MVFGIGTGSKAHHYFLFAMVLLESVAIAPSLIHVILPHSLVSIVVNVAYPELAETTSFIKLQI